MRNYSGNYSSCNTTCCPVYSNEYMATTGCTYYTSRQQCRKARHSQNESGRSMVEMLGVLAIAGVLTIGGVAGYNMAITKHRVNELHEFLRRTTVLTQSLPSLTAEGVQEIIDEQASSYLATAVMCSAGDPSDRGYVIRIQNVPHSMCVALQRYVNEDTYQYQLKTGTIFVGDVDCNYGPIDCSSEDDTNAVSFIIEDESYVQCDGSDCGSDDDNWQTCGSYRCYFGCSSGGGCATGCSGRTYYDQYGVAHANAYSLCPSTDDSTTCYVMSGVRKTCPLGCTAYGSISGCRSGCVDGVMYDATGGSVSCPWGCAGNYCRTGCSDGVALLQVASNAYVTAQCPWGCAGSSCATGCIDGVEVARVASNAYSTYQCPIGCAGNYCRVGCSDGVSVWGITGHYSSTQCPWGCAGNSCAGSSSSWSSSGSSSSSWSSSGWPCSSGTSHCCVGNAYYSRTSSGFYSTICSSGCSGGRCY